MSPCPPCSARAPSSASHRSAGLARLLILANCHTRACSGLSFLSTGPLDARQNTPRPKAPRYELSHLLRPTWDFSFSLPPSLSPSPPLVLVLALLLRSLLVLRLPFPPYSVSVPSIHLRNLTLFTSLTLSNFQSHRYAHATPQETPF